MILKGKQMNAKDIDEEFEKFIEFPSDSKKYVTSVSAKLFAKHCVDIVMAEKEEEHVCLLNIDMQKKCMICGTKTK